MFTVEWFIPCENNNNAFLCTVVVNGCLLTNFKRTRVFIDKTNFSQFHIQVRTYYTLNAY